MLRVGEGIALRQRGERLVAHRLFLELWEQIGGVGGDPFHRCAIAHSMADACDDVKEELMWDLLALEAAESVTDARAAEGGVSGSAAAFFPSLHLNLAECYRRIGDVERAAGHVVRGRAALGVLAEGGYSLMIRDGFDRIDKALWTASGE